MRVFMAGATGAMGRPVVKELVARGHEVVGFTRHEKGAADLRSLGAEAVVGNALDASRVLEAVTKARPTHVVHLLTSIPPNVTRPRHMEPTNELRIDGTANLIRAAVAAGAQRIVAESFPLVYGVGEIGAEPLTEETPLKPVGPWAAARAVEALRSLERQMAEARQSGAIESVVLRYGYIYGPDIPSTRDMFAAICARKMPILRNANGIGSFVHSDDVTAGTIAALEAPEVSGVYNIVDDEPASFNEFVTYAAEKLGAPQPRRVPFWLLRMAAPFIAEIATSRLPLSNARARAELGFVPAFPSFRSSFAEAATMPACA
jgi:2-alkyl-3-oxoalkanoate reductase